MELNIKQKTLKYYFDGNDKGIAFKNIDFTHNKPYFLALMLDNNTVIQLTDFYIKQMKNNIIV
eukprot:UN03997